MFPPFPGPELCWSCSAAVRVLHPRSWAGPGRRCTVGTRWAGSIYCRDWSWSCNSSSSRNTPAPSLLHIPLVFVYSLIHLYPPPVALISCWNSAISYTFSMCVLSAFRRTIETPTGAVTGLYKFTTRERDGRGTGRATGRATGRETGRAWLGHPDSSPAVSIVSYYADHVPCFDLFFSTFIFRHTFKNTRCVLAAAPPTTPPSSSSRWPNETKSKVQIRVEDSPWRRSQLAGGTVATVGGGGGGAWWCILNFGHLQLFFRASHWASAGI